MQVLTTLMASVLKAIQKGGVAFSWMVLWIGLKIIQVYYLIRIELLSFLKSVIEVLYGNELYILYLIFVYVSLLALQKS